MSISKASSSNLPGTESNVDLNNPKEADKTDSKVTKSFLISIKEDTAKVFNSIGNALTAPGTTGSKFIDSYLKNNQTINPESPILEHKHGLENEGRTPTVEGKNPFKEKGESPTMEVSVRKWNELTSQFDNLINGSVRGHSILEGLDKKSNEEDLASKKYVDEEFLEQRLAAYTTNVVNRKIAEAQFSSIACNSSHSRNLAFVQGKERGKSLTTSHLSSPVEGKSENNSSRGSPVEGKSENNSNRESPVEKVD